MFGINILGTGSYSPSVKVSNDDMSKIVETNDEWISTRTGIKNRFLTDGESAWKMGANAAKKAIESAGIDPEQIGLVIGTTVTPDFYTPSLASLVQNAVGAVNAAAFDLGAACSGFAYAVDAARRYLQTDDDLKYVLVVSSEILSRFVDYTDRATCVLFGDGAGAAVIERSDKLFTSFIGSDGSGAKFLYAKHKFGRHPFRTTDADDYGEDFTSTNEFLFQDGKEVYKFATKALPTAAQNAADKIGLDVTTIDWFVPHQANVRIIETAAKNLGAPMEKFIVTLDRHGNTSSASIPTAFDEAVRSGKIKKGDRVCFVGFGAGLTSAAVIFDY
ncbi:MAG: ketoacyl-ACP synthase III [Oscillospiraceae bacterium]|nr:ketoacyl-ACP synthase III [Oscillospiraceae bacterium]